jgi:hypothetical protein
MNAASLRANAPKLVFWGFLIALVASVAFFSAHRGVDGPVTNPTDFRAFYCSGRSVLSGADPYRVEPLRGCEAATLASAGLRWVVGMVVPTPQPPYTLGLFALFATLPFLVASSVWLAVLLAAWVRTVMLLRDLTGLRIVWPIVTTLALGLLASTTYGKMMPLTLWLFVETAAALRAGKDRRAIFFATLGTLEPHIGAPVWLAIFVLRPNCRRGLAVGALCLLAVSALALRAQYGIEWLTQVLPAQSMSELRDPEQYSLTSFLVLAGMAPDPAHLLGVLDYAAMLGLGIWAAARLEARWKDPAVIALVPPAFVVLGGMYMHENQLVAALPIGLLAFALTRRREFALAAGLLAIPWFTICANLFPQAGAAYAPGRHAELRPVAATDLAEISWARYVDAFAPQGRAVLIADLVKLPQWSGVALIVVPLLLLAAPARERENALDTFAPEPAR